MILYLCASVRIIKSALILELREFCVHYIEKLVIIVVGRWLHYTTEKGTGTQIQMSIMIYNIKVSEFT
jgi:hypothetical protein